jgi:hypothetical protein
MLTSTTSGGTVTVLETDTFQVLVTNILNELHQLADMVLQALGIQVTATPVGQQVNRVVVTVKQVPMVVGYLVVGGGKPTAPVFTYVQGGVTKSLTLRPIPTVVSVDAGSTWSVTPNPLGGSSSSERWYSPQTLTGKASPAIIVFIFLHQYYLNMGVSGPGTVTPTSGWYYAWQTVMITATPSSGHKFTSWTGSGAGSYTGTSARHWITMNAAITETATFT